jgi:hypothetical protein
LPQQSLYATTLRRSIVKTISDQRVKPCWKIGLPSSFGENPEIQRKNAETFRLSTLKVARKSFVFKGV